MEGARSNVPALDSAPFLLGVNSYPIGCAKETP